VISLAFVPTANCLGLATLDLRFELVDPFPPHDRGLREKQCAEA
jgi:hypothetical protein